MSFSVILTKAKALLPIAVVGGAVAITIKLLTASTPLINNLLNVPAEEDIAETKHEEILEEEPKPEEEEKEEEKAEETAEAATEEVEEPDSEDEEDGPVAGGDEEEEQKQEKEESKTEKRAFKAGNDVTTNILKKLLGAGEEE